MAATIWHQTVRTSIASRAQRVKADATPGWGTMNAGAILAHVNDSLRMALGDLPVKSKNLPLTYRPPPAPVRSVSPQQPPKTQST